jgi:putative transcriptional regulator
MSKTSTYKSSLTAAIHQTASGLCGAGMIDKQAMREFDRSCLMAVHDFTAEEIKALREREEVSQHVFAHYLNVSKDSVIKWERSSKHPAGPSLKRLPLVVKHGLEAIARRYRPDFSASFAPLVPLEMTLFKRVASDGRGFGDTGTGWVCLALGVGSKRTMAEPLSLKAPQGSLFEF